MPLVRRPLHGGRERSRRKDGVRGGGELLRLLRANRGPDGQPDYAQPYAVANDFRADEQTYAPADRADTRADNVHSYAPDNDAANARADEPNAMADGKPDARGDEQAIGGSKIHPDADHGADPHRTEIVALLERGGRDQGGLQRRGLQVRAGETPQGLCGLQRGVHPSRRLLVSCSDAGEH